MVGAAMFAVLLAMLTSTLLVNPIRQLERLAAQFGHTGVTPQFPVSLPRDEIGSLTSTFFNMAHELEDKRNQERRLIERLIYAQEEERKLVAYDLHDGLLPQLVGARFYLSNTETEDAALTQLNIRRGCDALTEAIVEGRRIIEGLRPAALDDLGLAAAIEEIARTVSDMAGWSLTLDIQPLPVEPDKTVGVTVYRIAQEALNNARKHANAQHVSVALHNGNAIVLTIEDDGVGFDVKAAPNGSEGESRGLGITTMRERASLIDGQCIIHSRPGGGTNVEVYVPLTFVGQNGLQTKTLESQGDRG
jgi:two-component system NarL family sensor kinase